MAPVAPSAGEAGARQNGAPTSLSRASTAARPSDATDGPGEKEPPASHPHQTAAWCDAGLVAVSEAVGVGVMSIPVVFGRLGFALGVLSVLAWSAVTTVMSYFVWVAAMQWPAARSLSDVAFYAFGESHAARWTVAALLYLTFFLVEGDFLLTMADTLSFVGYGSPPQCRYVWTAVSALVVLPFLQMRFLSVGRPLMVVNVVLIVAAVLTALAALTAEGADHVQERLNSTSAAALASGFDAYAFFSSQALLCFSFGAQAAYVEVISQMASPHDFFNKSVLRVSAPVVTALYLATGAWGYSLLGSEASGMLVADVMPGSPEYRAAAALLFLHLVVPATVFGVILVRALHRMLHPRSLDETSRTGFAIHLLLSVVVLTAASVTAVAIPLFDALTSLIGSASFPILAFFLPTVFYVRARAERANAEPLAAWELALGVAFVMWLALVLVFGTAAAVDDIQRHFEEAPGMC